MGQGDTAGGGAASSLSGRHQFQIPAIGLLLPDPTITEMPRKAKYSLRGTSNGVISFLSAMTREFF